MINSNIRFELIKKTLWDIYETAGEIMEAEKNNNSELFNKAMDIRADCRGILKEIDWDDYFKRQESEEAE